MKTNADMIIVAADGGGTGCRACAGTLARGMLAQSTGGPGNVHSDFDGAIANLTGAVAEALQAAGLSDVPLDTITAHMGVAGAHSTVEMDKVAQVLPYGRSRVTGDRATSVRGVLGEADGFVVALGTGTIVARQRDLEMTTVGGWGFDLSDHASGSWLGRRLLEEVLLAEDGLRDQTPLTRHALEKKGGLVPIVLFSADASPGDYAPLARDVVEHAAQGDALGLSLMQEGAAYLVNALETLAFSPGDTLCLAGGVGPHYATYLPEEFTRNLQSPKGTALDGAFALATQAARAAGA